MTHFHNYIMGESQWPPFPEPAWGTLPLDIFMLENWQSDCGIPARSQGHQLALNFLNLGIKAREVYYARAAEDPLIPTSEQIDEILRPFRPEFVRALVSPKIHRQSDKPIVWLRTAYHDEKASEALRAKYWDDGVSILDADALVLDDQKLWDVFDANSLLHSADDRQDEAWMQLLKVMPEIVTNDWYPESYLERRDAALKDIVENEYEDPYSFQLASLTSVLFLEDKAAYGDDKILVVFLDDHGRAVRQARLESNSFFEFSLLWADDRVDSTCFKGCEVAPAYSRGGACGPPYPYRPLWLQRREEAEALARQYEAEALTARSRANES